MNMRIVFPVVTISLLILSITIAGCVSEIPLVTEVPSIRSLHGNDTRELSIGDTVIVSSPEGSLEIIVRSFNATTGKILIDEKNIGTESFRYNPTLWLKDRNGVNYTTVYCRADLCPSYAFLTTLYPQVTEKRDFDNIYETFRVPEGGRQGKLTLFWSVDNLEASWIIIPG